MRLVFKLINAVLASMMLLSPVYGAEGNKRAVLDGQIETHDGLLNDLKNTQHLSVMGQQKIDMAVDVYKRSQKQSYMTNALVNELRSLHGSLQQLSTRIQNLDDKLQAQQQNVVLEKYQKMDAKEAMAQVNAWLSVLANQQYEIVQIRKASVHVSLFVDLLLERQVKRLSHLSDMPLLKKHLLQMGTQLHQVKTKTLPQLQKQIEDRDRLINDLTQAWYQVTQNIIGQEGIAQLQEFYKHLKMLDAIFEIKTSYMNVYTRISATILEGRYFQAQEEMDAMWKLVALIEHYYAAILSLPKVKILYKEYRLILDQQMNMLQTDLNRLPKNEWPIAHVDNVMMKLDDLADVCPKVPQFSKRTLTTRKQLNEMSTRISVHGFDAVTSTLLYDLDQQASELLRLCPWEDKDDY